MKFCPCCGTQLPDEAVFCGQCGGAVAATPEAVTTEVSDPSSMAVDVVIPPAKKISKKLIIIIVAAVVAVLVLVGALTNWFGLKSPLHGLIKAVEKTATADSLTMKVTVDDDGWEEEAEYRVILDKDKEKVTTLVKNDYGYELYDNGMRYLYREYGDGYSYANCYEIDVDEDVFDTYNDVFDGKKLNWEEIIDMAELDDYVDADEIDGFLKDIYRDQLCSNTWLDETLGFEKDGKTYIFKPDLRRLCKDVEDICNDSDVFDRESKDNIEYAMEDLRDDIRYYGAELEIVITVNKGVLKVIEIDFENDGGYYKKIKLEFSAVNETKINTAAMKKEVQEWIDEHTCPECDEVVSSWDSHGDCDRCGDHGYLYDDGLCYDCYWTCDLCGDDDNSYYYNGYDLCYDCYKRLRYGYDACYICGSVEEMWEYLGYDLCWDCYYRYKYGY